MEITIECGDKEAIGNLGKNSVQWSAGSLKSEWYVVRKRKQWVWTSLDTFTNKSMSGDVW